MKSLVLCVGGRYQLDCRLGFGGFGEVYQGHDLQTGQEVALKLEYQQIYPSHLKNEVYIYRKLSGGPGVPRVYWYGEEDDFRVMAFELLGPNLENLFNYCGRRFSLKTVLLLADQLILRLQYVHSKRYIHRDIKPENFLMGDGKNGNKVYITDIGLAKEIKDRQPGLYSTVVGTALYASINAHLGKGKLEHLFMKEMYCLDAVPIEQYPPDDLESLGYVLLYFLRGSLPWYRMKADSEEDKKLILERKQSPEECGLFQGHPIEFERYFQHIHCIKSGRDPDYPYLRRLFRNLFHRRGFQYDYVFDWTELKFSESLNDKEQAC